MKKSLLTTVLFMAASTITHAASLSVGEYFEMKVYTGGMTTHFDGGGSIFGQRNYGNEKTAGTYWNFLRTNEMERKSSATADFFNLNNYQGSGSATDTHYYNNYGVQMDGGFSVSTSSGTLLAEGGERSSAADTAKTGPFIGTNQGEGTTVTFTISGLSANMLYSLDLGLGGYYSGQSPAATFSVNGAGAKSAATGDFSSFNTLSWDGLMANEDGTIVIAMEKTVANTARTGISSLKLSATGMIPEPSTYALLGGLAAAGVALAARRRRKN